MASNIQETPFVKALASSGIYSSFPPHVSLLCSTNNPSSTDRKIRDAALDSLRLYIHSNREFTDLELLKLWKGLFFCMWHSDRPIPQQKLAVSLSSLVSLLPQLLFIPFLRAFWITIAREWTVIDALRMNKFMFLVRCYVNAGFGYLGKYGYDEELVEGHLEVIREIPLSVGNGKVSDGLRYHVLDVWVDELDKIDEGREGVCPVELLMEPVRTLAKEGMSKTLRTRAKETAGDDRLSSWSTKKGTTEETGEDEDEEWGGLGD